MSTRLALELDLPPSLNHAYKTLRNGRRALSGAGARYKRRAVRLVQQEAERVGWRYQDGQRVALAFRFSFAPASDALSDLSNRIKLLEDALASALDFNDRSVDELHVYRGARGAPGALVVVSILEEQHES